LDLFCKQVFSYKEKKIGRRERRKGWEFLEYRVGIRVNLEQKIPSISSVLKNF